MSSSASRSNSTCSAAARTAAAAAGCLDRAGAARMLRSSSAAWIDFAGPWYAVRPAPAPVPTTVRPGSARGSGLLLAHCSSRCSIRSPRSPLDHGAGIGPPPKWCQCIELHRRADTRHISSAAHGSRHQCLGGVIMSAARHTACGERYRRGHAALHLIEISSAPTDRNARAALAETVRQIEAPPTPCTGSTITAAVRSSRAAQSQLHRGVQ